MEIRFLGTGNAVNTDGRGSPAVLVAPAGTSPFLVDAGPTLMQAFARFGVACDPVDRLFLTHLHGDHTAGWPFFLLHQLSLELRQRPIDVYGPPGTRRHLERLADLCYSDIFSQTPFEVRYHELPLETAHGRRSDGLTFDVLPMRHHESSIGYRFDVDGVSVGVTGDTAWCDNLERLAAACDFLILECSTLEPSPWMHLSLEEVRERRERLGRGHLLLVHVSDAVAGALARDPIPRVLAAHDGLCFTP